MPAHAERTLRFGLIGAGFWAPYQLAAWGEVAGAECVAICDNSPGKAAELARRYGIAAAYENAEELLRTADLDFVDIVTSVETHAPLVSLAAQYRVPAICQKPMAPSMACAERMVEECRAAGVGLFVHENWRWQTPIRALKNILAAQPAGEVFRARISMITGFDPLENQPGLKLHPQLILSDLGVHLLDTARFLFGEADSLYAHTHRVQPGIAGEDAATVVIKTAASATVTCEMAYAGTALERECFPQTLAFIEGSKGSIEVVPGYEIRVTNAAGTRTATHAPRHYAWANPQYDVVHASMVECHANLLHGLRGGAAETSGEDTLKTMRLVFAAYESAAAGSVVRV